MLGQLEGPGLRAVIEREVDELLDVGARLRLDEVVSRDELVGVLQRAARLASRSDMVLELATEVPVRVHGMPANAEHRLDEVVRRADVEAVVAAVLGLDRWHERTLERLAGSPLVGVVAYAFVTRLVSDVLTQNTDLARRLPGMSSLISFGGSAVGKVKGLADRQLEAVFGDALGKGGELAVRRVNSALLAVLRTGPVRGAMMESWDLEASEPISALAEDLPVAAVRQLASGAATLAAGSTGTEYAASVVAASVDVLLDRYGRTELATLVTDVAGCTREDLVELAEGVLRPALAAVRESGDLERVLRERLAPFFGSAEVRALLRPRRQSR